MNDETVNYCAMVDAQSPYPAYSGEQAYIVEAQMRGAGVVRRHGSHRRRQGFAIVAKMCAKYGLDPINPAKDGAGQRPDLLKS